MKKVRTSPELVIAFDLEQFVAWAELRDPLNEFMRKESEEIHHRLATARCRSRVNQLEEITSSFYFSLPHPYDFHPSVADICWVPEVQKAIADGTDREFQDCVTDIRSRISELSTAWLEERRNILLQCLPQDPPTLKHLSLTTSFFDCMRCHKLGMRTEEVLSHHCRSRYGSTLEEKLQFSNPASETVYRYDVGPPWSPELARYRYSAALASTVSEIVLECGENPDVITTREMDRKHHRFVRFDVAGTVSVLNWVEAVSTRAW